MIEKLVPFALVLGLSSLALAGSPPARAPGKGAQRPARQALERSPDRARDPAQTRTREHGHHDDRFRGVKLKLANRSAPSGPVTVYVNGEGAVLHGGFEDAASNRSSIVEASGFGTVSLPAYAGGASRWRQVMGCVEDQFRDFDVAITDQRPATDTGYIMIMVGGSPGDVGERGGVAGVAPYMGSVIRGAVGFAFSEVHGGDTRGLCETVAHEIGHTLGLDHTHECSDTMSYLQCGEKSFRNATMACGEWDPRSCGSGSGTQNSHALLAGALGLRSGGSDPAPVSPPPAPTPDPDPIQDPSPDEWVAGFDEWVVWVDEDGDEWLVWIGSDDDWGEGWVEWVEEGEGWDDWDDWGSGGCGG